MLLTLTFVTLVVVGRVAEPCPPDVFSQGPIARVIAPRPGPLQARRAPTVSECAGSSRTAESSSAARGLSDDAAVHRAEPPSTGSLHVAQLPNFIISSRLRLLPGPFATTRPCPDRFEGLLRYGEHPCSSSYPADTRRIGSWSFACYPYHSKDPKRSYTC